MVIETDETLLLDLLNTTPIVDGTQRDNLADDETGRQWLAAHGQPSTDDEWRAALDARCALQDVIRGYAAPTALARYIDGVSYRAALSGDGVTWTPDLPEGRSTAATASPTAPAGVRWPCAATA
jgi:hypothetical protein